eukprot:316533-Pleurochrysis_carterae.AAC.1
MPALLRRDAPQPRVVAYALAVRFRNALLDCSRRVVGLARLVAPSHQREGIAEAARRRGDPLAAGRALQWKHARVDAAGVVDEQLDDALRSALHLQVFGELGTDKRVRRVVLARGVAAEPAELLHERAHRRGAAAAEARAHVEAREGRREGVAQPALGDQNQQHRAVA